MGMNFQELFAESLQETAMQLKSEIIQSGVIPKDQGSLETSHHVNHSVTTGDEISASTPYARRLYMHPEYHFRKGENQNAKGRWFEDWESGGKYENRASEILAQKFRQRTGG